MDQPKIERLLRLMKLLTGNISHNINDLSKRLDMSVRTIYRYIDTFREAGFIIKKQGDFIRLDKSSPYFKDISQLIHFTEEEAYILKSAIESIDENNLLKQNLKRKLYTVYDYKILAETVVNGKNACNVNALIDAITNQKQVLLCNYSSANSREIRTRLIEPFAFTTNYIQIWGYEHESGKNKLFKLSRIESVEILPNLWQNENLHKPGFIDIFRISSFTQTPIKLHLSLRAANLLMEEYPLSVKFLTKINSNKWVLETNVCGFEGVCRFYLGLYNEIEIIESDSLKTFVRNRIKMIKI